jgi:hypothetical protein
VENMMPPNLTYLTTIKVEVGAPIEVGPTSEGYRRIIPITGGTAEGPEFSGTVLSGGADFQLLKSDTMTELEAKYVVETDNGERVYVTNFGVRCGSKDDIAKLVRGEEVDPARIYFRCTPRLLSSGERWSWLGSRILVGTGERYKNSVHLVLYVVE